MLNAIGKFFSLLTRPAPISQIDPKAMETRRFHEIERARLNSFQI